MSWFCLFSGAVNQRPLSSLGINEWIVDRHYQQRAIRAIAEHFDD